MTTAPRVPPGNRQQAGTLAWLIAHAGGVQAKTQPLNLFLTLGRHRALFRGWLRFAGRLMPGGTLARRETELVILRVAALRSCDYEFEHHVRIGGRAGVTSADIERVQLGPRAGGWTDREQAVIEAVDMLHERSDLDDPTWERLRGALDDRECIELVMLVGHYEMLATTIAALRIQTDLPRRRRLP